ncbi:MAG: tRNA threonylcarbamoyladenosine biosynthesis protein RimN [Gammaproteobacteria bacterium]|nr:tRNA threonylcarbamoyladenosine biosynthesis protein RimN [Gammaproteobacteria bacterium]
MPQSLSKSLLGTVDEAVVILKSGGVIAYPTEAVYGLGCDPFNESAVQALFHVKQRPIAKGVILVAANVAQVKALVELEGMPWEGDVLASWPGPVTWVLPLKHSAQKRAEGSGDKNVPDWITGGRDTVAIRVSDHPVIQAVCLAYGGPIVSTSANITEQLPATSCEEIHQIFRHEVFCVNSALGTLSQPTQIRHAETGHILRA